MSTDMKPKYQWYFDDYGPRGPADPYSSYFIGNGRDPKTEELVDVYIRYGVMGVEYVFVTSVTEGDYSTVPIEVNLARANQILENINFRKV